MGHRHAEARDDAVGEEEEEHVGGEVAEEEADDGDEGADEAGELHAEYVLEEEAHRRQEHQRENLQRAERRCRDKQNTRNHIHDN